MDFGAIMEAISNNGLAIVLVVVFVFYGRSFINKVIDRYANELNCKNTTINNHLAHLNDAVNIQCVEHAKGKEAMDQGFNRVVEAINAQTMIIAKIKLEEDKNEE